MRSANAVGEDSEIAHLADAARLAVMKGIAMAPNATDSKDITMPAVLATLKKGVRRKANMIIDKPNK